MRATTCILLILSIVIQLSTINAEQCPWGEVTTCEGATQAECDQFDVTGGRLNCRTRSIRDCAPLLSMNFNVECFNNCRTFLEDCCCPFVASGSS
mmetsp:Transcript_38530/g.38950  ORF Transcript_38530/g.38950 Transcript_38530/m.38950 type:complete len:95 (-) Transcript_38530:403-687(-)